MEICRARIDINSSIHIVICCSQEEVFHIDSVWYNS